MKATKQFIEDAIKGGWGVLPRINKHASRYEITGDNVDLKYRDNFHETTIQAILLDPLAWQAVGKTRGWENGYPDRIYEAFDTFFYQLYNGDSIEEALEKISN